MVRRYSRVVRATLALALAAGACLLSPLPAASAAEAYPSAGPVTLIVPYPAGGPSDTTARIFADPIGKTLHQKVIVDNIGGATGTIAANRVLNARADGYLFFQGSPNELILPTLVNKAVTFKPEDFDMVQPIARATIVLVARSNLGVDSLDDFIRLARKRKDAPLSFGSVGMGSMYHLITERMAKEMGFKVQHVPYRGSSPALIDLAGGRIDFAVLPFQTSMLSLQHEGRLKIISTLGSKAPPALNEIPKVTDSKLLKNFDYGITGAYFVKKGTPQKTMDALHQAIDYALQQPAVRQSMEEEGRSVFDPMSADASRAYWKKEIRDLRGLVEIVGYQAQ